MAESLGGRGRRFQGDGPLSFLWLEITGKCNLECVHCYAESGPHVRHGSMATPRWLDLLGEARGLGARAVQFIGGEPTLHPDFSALVRRAAELSLEIEVFSNLAWCQPRLWELFEECNVSVATSFYSLNRAVHRRVTRRDSQVRTLANIREAVRRGIGLRVGIIEVDDQQQVVETEAMLRTLGVENVGVDRMRKIGRGSDAASKGDLVDELCGSCGMKYAAVDPDGWVSPCVFSRWLRIGNAAASGLDAVITSRAMDETRGMLNHRFESRDMVTAEAIGQTCGPGTCNPNCVPSCTPSCKPAEGGCIPNCFP